MSAKALDLDFIKQLREKQAKPTFVREAVSLQCKQCGQTLNPNGYCKNTECPVDAPVVTYPCATCGHCETPNKCHWSFDCPLCFATIGNYCYDGERMVPAHDERLSLAAA